MKTGTISAKLVRKPRKDWGCDSCGNPIGRASHVRLFGSAEPGDKPYRITICIECADRCAGAEPKVLAALSRDAKGGE